MLKFAVAAFDGEEIIKHYSYDDEGYMAAYDHAKRLGYELWETYNGQAIYLLRKFAKYTGEVI